MKTIYFRRISLLLIAVFFVQLTIFAQNRKETIWTKETATAWYKSSKWANGLKYKIHPLLDVITFATQYHRNQAVWDKAYDYLNTTGFDTASTRKFKLDGDKLTVSITEGPLKEPEAGKWEAHKKYMDIQFVISGKEKMGLAPLVKATVTEAYNDAKDVAFFSVTKLDCTWFEVPAGTMVFFFPNDAHCPSLKTPDCDKVKKVVIKVLITE
jgi:biofilm protein TabA